MPNGTYAGVDLAELAAMDVEERGLGDERIAAALRLSDEASRPRPLAEVLAAICAEIAAIVRTDVVSLYLRERTDEGEALRMAANVGFPANAIDRVRMRVGEGITGFVAETLRPASVVLAPEHRRYKHFPELREERFPIFLAVPLLIGHRAEGVVVLQRAAGPFDDDAILLATALSAAFALALERSHLHRRDVEAPDAPHPARLVGSPLARGRAMGRVETPPTFEGLLSLERRREAELGTEEDGDEPSSALRARRAAELEGAIAQVVGELAATRKRLAPRLDPEAGRALDTLALLETDERLRETILEEGSRRGVALGLRKVAREYAQAVYRGARVAGAPKPSEEDRAWLADRSAEVEDLCLLIAARAVHERAPTRGSVLLLPDRLTAMMALGAATARVNAIAICHPVGLEPLPLGVVVARAQGIATIGDVGGLFAWAREGDLALVDGDEGTVRLHPSAAQIAELRARAQGGDGSAR